MLDCGDSYANAANRHIGSSLKRIIFERYEDLETARAGREPNTVSRWNTAFVVSDVYKSYQMVPGVGRPPASAKMCHRAEMEQLTLGALKSSTVKFAT